MSGCLIIVVVITIPICELGLRVRVCVCGGATQQKYAKELPWPWPWPETTWAGGLVLSTRILLAECEWEAKSVAWRFGCEAWEKPGRSTLSGGDDEGQGQDRA